MKAFKITPVAAIAGILLLLAVFQSCQKEKELDKFGYYNKEFIILLYEHGYQSGINNELTTKTKEESTMRWRKDSAYIVNEYLK